MRKVKYSIIYHNMEDICDIIVEDGGVAAVHCNDDGLHLSLYKDRVTGWHHYGTTFFDEFGPSNIADFDESHVMWPNLMTGVGTQVSQELIDVALNWLYLCTEPIEFIEVSIEELFN